MASGKMYALGISALLVAVVGIRVGLIYRERHEDVPVAKTAYHVDPDDNVFLKHEHPDTLKDEKDLKGRTLWVSAGGQMDYYPYKGGKVDFSKSQGVLLGAEKIVVQDAVEQVAPKATTFRIPGGEKQVLLVFTKAAGPTEYAVPVGYRENGTYTYSTDEIFFYDDPHQLYSHWSPEIWKAVDEHKAIVGMNERQVQLALGQISKAADGSKIGDRAVEYDYQGHPERVVFEHGKATSINAE